MSPTTQIPPSLGWLRFWFLLALVFGSVASPLLSRLFGAGWLTVVGPPLLAMGLYLVVGWATQRYVTASSQFADSVYYLGFLFTLVALFFSLLAMGDGDSLEVASVVRRFGLALTTTIAGLAVRTYLTAFRVAPEDETARSQQALSDAAGRLRAEVERISTDLIALDRSFRAAHENALRHTIATIDRSTSAVSEASAKAADELAATIRTGSSNIAEALESGGSELSQATETSAGALHRSARMLRDSVVPLSELPEGHFRNALDRPAREFTAAVESHIVALRRTSLGTTLAELEHSLAGVVERTGELAAGPRALPALAERFEQLSSSAEAAGSELERLRGDLQQQREGSAAMLGQMKEELAMVERLRGDLEQRLAAAGDALAQVHRQVIDAAQYLRQELQSRGR